jgi:hypothetical protein
MLIDKCVKNRVKFTRNLSQYSLSHREESYKHKLSACLLVAPQGQINIFTVSHFVDDLNDIFVGRLGKQLRERAERVHRRALLVIFLFHFYFSK